MKCSSSCKYFKTNGFSGKCTNNAFGEIDHTTIHGKCNKYLINISTDEECLDTLPYHKK